jgi:hypothetical protein
MMFNMELQCQMSHLRIEGKLKKESSSKCDFFKDKYECFLTWCVSLLPDHVECPSVIPPQKWNLQGDLMLRRRIG